MASTPWLYLHNAHGHALSGQVTAPFSDTIEAQAATSLPHTGGHGSASANNFSYKNMISFKAARTHTVGGVDSNKNYTSMISVCVEGFNILDVITADRIVARMATSHKPDEPEASITIAGTHFDNLRIAGSAVAVSLDNQILPRIDTFQALMNQLAKDPNFKNIALNPFGTTAMPEPGLHGAIVWSCIQRPLPTIAGATATNHWYDIPEFGRVYLCELTCEYRKRRLTMLRIEMGSPITRNAIALDLQGNGTPIPPPPPH